ASERPYASRIELMLDALSGHNRPSSANARGAPPPRSALDRPSNHATWSVALGFSRNVQFHAVRSGRCWIRVNDGAAVELRDDDFAVLPHGDPHEVTDDPRTPAVPAAELLAGVSRVNPWIVEIGKDGSLSHIICAGFACTLGAPLPLSCRGSALALLLPPIRSQQPYCPRIELMRASPPPPPYP